MVRLLLRPKCRYCTVQVHFFCMPETRVVSQGWVSVAYRFSLRGRAVGAAEAEAAPASCWPCAAQKARSAASRRRWFSRLTEAAALAAASAMARLASSVRFHTKTPSTPTASDAPRTTPASMRVRLDVGRGGSVTWSWIETCDGRIRY